MFLKDTCEAVEEVDDVLANITLAFYPGPYRRGGSGELRAS